MKAQLLAAAGALAIGGAFAVIVNPVVGVTIGVSVLGGALNDLNRRRRKAGGGERVAV
ncbi:hypothetical protein HP499_11210 [Paenarthrobacter sp. CM16]|uniref:hypothetical protein n=1 Tax=Paenarthrobacter sp. CM16 TaxID=2738447 RepID=UPI001557069B|nr:hypothetical protein [Paenarthrobacter sp. CM16]NQD88372.1 hypothetical protein [Paenarthrobacter sp. CM16]